MAGVKRSIKQVWEKVPFSADIEWHLYWKHHLETNPAIQRLRQFVEENLAQMPHPQAVPKRGKKIFLFSLVHVWIRYSATLGLALSGMGHSVKLGYLPYRDWFDDLNPFQQKLRNYYYQYAQEPLRERLEVLPLLNAPKTPLPEGLAKAIHSLSVRDFQYTRQVEEVNQDDPLFLLRLRRNREAAAIFLHQLQADPPDVVIVPNGLILEFGALFEVARYLDIDVVSYEFGEQRDKIWISRNSPVMHQDTAEIWRALKDQPFTDEERGQIETLFASRQNASLWQEFSRQWQQVPAEGRQAVKEKVGLDGRPVVLLASNVIGDSLTLGRQVFSESMTLWIERTLEFFSDKPQVQFVLRIHPGERYTEGPSVEDILREKFPNPPAHFRIISADDPINTYDLIAAADLGLTYTTTVGMEMAMTGLTVISCGETHYRGKGFTLDPDSWEAYFDILEQVLAAPEKYQLTEAQRTQAWHYAYRFFFNYPFPCPWHLRSVLEMVQQEPIREVLSAAGMAKYGRMFAYLTGETVEWNPSAPSIGLALEEEAGLDAGQTMEYIKNLSDPQGQSVSE